MIRIEPGKHNAPVYFFRRSRGYAPDPIQLPFEVPALLATGPELKNTFCVTRQRYAFVSHHIGDMENYETLRSFEDGIEHFERLFRIHPKRLFVISILITFPAVMRCNARSKITSRYSVSSIIMPILLPVWQIMDWMAAIR